MTAFARTSETLIFVRGKKPRSADDTVTEILARPAKLATPAVHAHRPPKPRTSREGDLPSIMVAQDSWVPPEPTRRTRMADTMIRPLIRPQPRPQPQGVPAHSREARIARGSEMSARQYNLTLASIAIGIGLLCLYMAPLFSRVMETAFAAMNR